VPLFALIDEDESDPATAAAASQPEPLYALIDEDESEEAAPPSEPLYALIDEDEDEPGESTKAPVEVKGAPRPAPAPTRPRDQTPSLAEVSLADLASLDDQSPAPPPARRPRAAAGDDQAGVPGPLAHLLGDELREEAG